MTADINGLRKAVTKQLDLRLDQYEGIAKEGDLIIDTNPGPTLNQVFIGTANGSLVQLGGGGSGSYSNANVANYLPTYTGNISGDYITLTHDVTANVIDANYLYGDGSNVTNVAALTANTVIDAAQPNITSVGTLTSLTVAGDILPDANVTYNLGSPTQRWDSIYLSNNTIYLGNNALSVDSGGNLTVDGNMVATVSSGGNLVVVGEIQANNIGTVAGLSLNGNAQTVLAGDGTWIAAGGGGNASLPLANGTTNFDIATVNGNATVTANGYTWTFNEANGALDIPGNITAVNAEIQLYTSPNYDMLLSSGDDIRIQGYNRPVGDYSEGGDINIYAGSASQDDGSSSGAGGGGDLQLYGGAGGGANVFNGGGGGYARLRGGSGGSSSATASAGEGGYVELRAGNAGGNLGNPAFGAVGGYVFIKAGGSSGEALNGGHIDLETGTAGANALAGYAQITIPGSPNGTGGIWKWTGDGTTFETPQNATIHSPLVGDITLGALNGNVKIKAASGGIDNFWTFDNAGNLTLPQGGVISEGGGLTGSAITLTPAGGSAPTQALLIYPTYTEGDHVHLTSGGGNTELYLGDDFHYVKLADAGNVEVKADDGAGSTAAWAFDPAGGLTFPDGTTQTTAYIDPDEPAYRGFYAGLNRFYGADPSVNQIIISNATAAPTYRNASLNTYDDAFKASGLDTATIVVMLNLYGSSSSEGLNPTTLKAVAELFIDNVLFDGATPVTDAATAKARFYANWSTIFAPVSGDLYNNFLFWTPYIFEGVVATGGTGSGFTPILRNNGSTYAYDGWNNGGTGYTIGDVLTITGDQYSGATPTNDAIITVTNVSAFGEVIDYTVSGTPVNQWPYNSISDGGGDQYDTGNFIDTDVASQIPYNNGDVDTSGSYWGGSSEYVSVYQTSTWAMMAFNTAVTLCGYNGGMGANGDGFKEVQNLIGGTSGISLGDFMFSGDTMTAISEDMYIKANDDLYLEALDDDIHLRANDDVRVYVSYNFTNNTYNGQWVFRSGEPPYIEWPDGSSQVTAWTAQQTQTDQFVNGFGNPDGYVPSVDGSGNFVWRPMATGGSQAIQYDNGGYPTGTANAAIYGTGAIHVNSVSTLADTSVNVALSLMDSDFFVRTITGATTFTPADVPAAGRTGSFVLQLTNPGTNVTWWSGIKWNNGTPPTLTTTGTDVLGFYTYDGGTTWVGLVLAQNIS